MSLPAKWHNWQSPLAQTSQPATEPTYNIAPVERHALTREEAASSLGMSVDGIDQLIQSGKLQAIRPSGRRVLVPIKAIEAFIDQAMAEQVQGGEA